MLVDFCQANFTPVSRKLVESRRVARLGNVVVAIGTCGQEQGNSDRADQVLSSLSYEARGECGLIGWW